MKTSYFSWTIQFALLTACCFCSSQLLGDVDPDDFFGRLTIDGQYKVPYHRTSPLNQKNVDVERAIIAIHGYGRDAASTFEKVYEMVEAADELDSTLIIVPHFQTATDLPLDDELFWHKDGWSKGNWSKDGTQVSSYEVADHIYLKLCNINKFPNLETISLIGHSAGGQYTNRYAAAGKAWAQPGVATRFVVMNPGSYLYLSEERVAGWGPADYYLYTPSNGSYNDYKYGLENANKYVKATGINKCIQNLTSRNVYYLGGTSDTSTSGPFDTSTAAGLQGYHRFDRFRRYRFHVETYDDPVWNFNSEFLEVPGIGHNERKMYESNQAFFILFF